MKAVFKLKRRVAIQLNSLQHKTTFSHEQPSRILDVDTSSLLHAWHRIPWTIARTYHIPEHGISSHHHVQCRIGTRQQPIYCSSQFCSVSRLRVCRFASLCCCIQIVISVGLSQKEEQNTANLRCTEKPVACTLVASREFAPSATSMSNAKPSRAKIESSSDN